MTDEATRALWQEQGWRLVVHTPEYEDWRLLSDPQDTGITIVHWGPPMLTGNSALILKALSCGIKVPGFVVVREEDAVNADYWKGHASFLEKLLEVSGIRSLSFEEWLAKRSPELLDSKLAAMIEGFLSSLTPPKDGT